MTPIQPVDNPRFQAHKPLPPHEVAARQFLADMAQSYQDEELGKRVRAIGRRLVPLQYAIAIASFALAAWLVIAQ